MMSGAITEEGRPNGRYFVGFALATAVIFGGIFLFDRAPAGWKHGPVAAVAAIILVIGALGYLGWYATREIVISVASDGLTVNTRRGDVFSFGDATLGLWAYGSTTKTMGTALHLRSGPHHFVLGGRDHRIAAGARLDEPPAGYVDAWLWASDFDELLTMVSRRSRLDAHRPASGELTRCLLFPNLELEQQMSVWAYGAKHRLWRSASQTCLAIDVSADAIRVINPNSNAPIATAERAQVTATPETYICRRFGLGLPYKNPSPSPVLVVHLPGRQPLTIGCHERRLPDFAPRFSWRGKVPDRVNAPAAYSVAAGDWLMLVEEFGLAPYLEDKVNRASG
jgi:hypothetical protein